MANQGIYPEEAGQRSSAGGLPAHILTLSGGRENGRDYQVYAVVGSGRGTGGKLTRRLMYFFILLCRSGSLDICLEIRGPDS